MNKTTSIPTDIRTETDLLGSVEIPAANLYGINAVRGVENLTVSAAISVPAKNSPRHLRCANGRRRWPIMMSAC